MLNLRNIITHFFVAFYSNPRYNTPMMHTETLQNLAAMYSDMYKDVHGFRPRGFIYEGWTADDYERELADLEVALLAVMAEENARADRSAAAFEKLVADLMASGAADRATAIRWLHDAENTAGDDGYLEYCMGLRYGYLQKETK